MNEEKDYSALNSFFNRKLIKELTTSSSSKLAKVTERLIQIQIESELGSSENLVEIYQSAYSEMNKYYRNEYIYKNVLLNKLLFGIHSPKTSTALTEVPIHNSKADFIFINGKAVVYEIKTALDNLERLSIQIQDYQKAFDHVTVVVSDDKVEKVFQKFGDSPVGIYRLNKTNTITRLKEPTCYSEKLDKEILFQILRKKEYEEIICEFFKELPKVPVFEYYDSCKKMCTTIPIEKLYPSILKQLKKRGNKDVEMLEKAPYEVKFLTYFLNLKNVEYDCLINNLNKKI